MIRSGSTRDIVFRVVRPPQRGGLTRVGQSKAVALSLASLARTVPATVPKRPRKHIPRF
jgi:hypothetical protein